MINAARVGEPVRPRLLWLQRYIVREVYRSFATLAGLPEDASRQIEDLVDLRRFNAAITELANHQESLKPARVRSRPARIRRGRPGAICAPRSVRSPNALQRSSSTSAA